MVEALVDAVPLELVQLGLQASRETHAISRMTLPASPERMAARASSILASGKRCVITGRGASSPLDSQRRIWGQVSSILRPNTPHNVLPLTIISPPHSTNTPPSPPPTRPSPHPP